MRRSRTIFPRQSRGENGNLFVPFGAIFIATGREEFARRNCGIAREFVFFFFSFAGLLYARIQSIVQPNRSLDRRGFNPDGC